MLAQKSDFPDPENGCLVKTEAARFTLPVRMCYLKISTPG
jgi:hypothetical protein